VSPLTWITELHPGRAGTFVKIEHGVATKSMLFFQLLRLGVFRSNFTLLA
jgi:hypothetical protein